MLQNEYNDGFDARAADKPAICNPWLAGDPAHVIWHEGWQDADTMIRLLGEKRERPTL